MNSKITNINDHKGFYELIKQTYAIDANQFSELSADYNTFAVDANILCWGLFATKVIEHEDIIVYRHKKFLYSIMNTSTNTLYMHNDMIESYLPEREKYKQYFPSANE